MRMSLSKNWIRLARWTAVAMVIGIAVVTRHTWWPRVSAWVDRMQHGEADSATADEAAHDDPDSLTLTPQARLNLGLTPDQIQPVTLQAYDRSFTVPAIVAEVPGRTHLVVSAPLTGVVTTVHISPGEAVVPGDLLFQMRLTHEDLVQAQVNYLKTLSEFDVERRELERLQPLVNKGVVSPVLAREREYAADKLRALQDAQREALRLHGLTAEQIDGIAASRRLLREVEVVAPVGGHATPEQLRLTGEGQQPVSLIADESRQPDLLLVQSLQVHKGQALTAGASMCVLADYRRLFIEGAAFEQDSPALDRAAAAGWTVSAVLHTASGQANVVDGLEIVYVANEVDVESRTLHFYVGLNNELLNSPADATGPQFVNWRFRPGQRLQLRIPIETFDDQIVLPVDAVTRDGAEQYVFVENGGHFDRRAVHVQFRDQTSVVIANDGSLFPGDRVALRGAHQMQMALKNRVGGGADPHAGHSH